jgi:cytochrome c-type biogenesis protein CcmH
VREQLKTGKSDDEVRAWLVQRYGDFILLKPPVNLRTALLWGLPAAVLLAGAIGVFAASRRRRAATAAAPLSEEERRKLDALLGGKP